MDVNFGIKYDSLLNRIEEYKENKNVIVDYIELINKVSPTVVSISDESDKLLQQRFYKGNCSGVIINNRGYILTNYSSIKDFEKVFVKVSSIEAKTIEGRIVIQDESTDLAIIRINVEEELSHIEIGEVDEILEGQEIAILANSIGSDRISSIMPGLVTSKSNKIIGVEGKEYSLLQVTAPINEENLGGVICNSKGELIGIASLEITKNQNQYGLYYGIQMKEIESIINSTNIFKTILGIESGGLTIDSTDYKGYYVGELNKESNAYQAGIRPTDIILEIDELSVDNVEDLLILLENKKKGDNLSCKILSKGKIKIANIVID